MTNNQIPNLVLALGPESLLADRATERIVAEIRANEPLASVQTLSAAEIGVGEIGDALAPSLFGERRVLVIRDLQDLSADCAGDITSYLSNPDENITLILMHKGVTKGKALLDAVKKAKPLEIACKAIKKDNEKLDFIRAEFAGHGRKIDAEAARALVDAVGGDVRELAGAASQLVSDIVGAIDSAAVERYHGGRVEATGFKVADAAIDGNIGVALATLRQALDTGTDPVLITSALASGIRTLAKVGSASRGVRSAELAGQLGLAPWQIDKARRQLAGWNAASITVAVQAAARADGAVKGGESDPIYALERAVMTIAKARS
ncbi:MAG TPA: DNA polymerase III subunit delta [Candidatus Nanopelagicaceae bacterium]|nr:DNA polymerase III subunit delta [Candidatus Nanopelagicaceae bacterium]